MSSKLYFSVLLLLGFDCNASALPKEKPCASFGTVCSQDCTKILGCTQIGAEPIDVKTCFLETDGHAYCKQLNSTSATCTSDAPDCITGESPNGVKCGSFGEFPHPTKCDTSVRCREGSDTPDNICSCPSGSFVDIATPGLPCLVAASCTRAPVACTVPGTNGKVPGSTVFCYTCGENDVWLYYCNLKEGFGSMLAPEPKISKNCETIK